MTFTAAMGTAPMTYDEHISLYSLTRRIGGSIHLLQSLRRVTGERRVYWSAGRLAYAGWGVAAVASAEAADRIPAIRADLAVLFADVHHDTEADTPDEARPRAFGGFAFRADEPRDAMWAAFPAAYFVVPRVMLTQTGDGVWLTVNQAGDHADDLPEAFARIATWLAIETDESNPAPIVRSIDYPLTRAGWAAGIYKAQDHMHAGELGKVVLARTAEARFNHQPDPIAALERLTTAYPNAYRFLIEPTPGHAFFGATPELLAQRDGAHLNTVALAGSRPRGATAAQDETFARDLLASEKERGEHEFVVEALHERLTPLAEALDIPIAPTIVRLSNIQHLYTPVRAELHPGVDLLDVIETLHPTPAMGGTPQREALALIQQLEATPRGWYAAPVGWIDSAGDGVFAVAIRSAVTAGERARLYAGAGIVGASDPDTEWDETALKFRPLLDALGVERYARAQS